MIGSCHTISVVHRNINITGLPGLRRQPLMNTRSSTISITTEATCRNAMEASPKRNLTGRGRPCTFGFATRGSRATRQFAMKKSANAANAAPAIQPPQPRLSPRGDDAGWLSASGMDWSVLISYSPFLSEAVDEVRVDAVGVQS